MGRLSRDGTLVIDGEQEVTGSSGGPLQVLNVQGNIFFGELPCMEFVVSGFGQELKSVKCMLLIWRSHGVL